jgi:hypothetical protein
MYAPSVNVSNKTRSRDDELRSQDFEPCFLKSDCGHCFLSKKNAVAAGVWYLSRVFLLVQTEKKTFTENQ